MPNHECRMPRPTSNPHHHRAGSISKSRQHSTPRAHNSRNLHARTTFVRSIHALSPDSSCITPDILRKCALVARHESPSSSVRFKRRQLGSQVESDKAPNAPDDRANTDLAITEPATSGLGVVMHAPACMTLRRESQPLNRLSWTTPRCLAQARQARARRFRCASRLPALLIQAKRADHPTHAETESWSNLTNAPKPQQRPRSCLLNSKSACSPRPPAAAAVPAANTVRCRPETRGYEPS